MTTECLIKVKAKKSAWRRYIAVKQRRTYQLYARARNQAKWTCKRAMKEYEKKISKSVKRNPKAFWNYVNSKMKHRETIPELKVSNNSQAKTDMEKARTFSDFFKTVFTREDVHNLPVYPNKEVTQELLDIHFTPDDVHDLLKNINVGKSPGPDRLHPRVLHELADSITKPLFMLFRTSIDEGKLPLDWKEAVISPIYKNKGSKYLPTNYRPVSLTSVVCKIFEKIIRLNIIQHMRVNNLFSKDQHGFMEGRSCITNLLVSLENWTNIIDDKGSFDCIFLDFMKAFDAVPHERLLLKTSSYGIQGKILSWLRDFLCGRGQRVIVNGESSNREAVISGVPQGSVLGPVLFVLFINDLPDVVSASTKLFADDTKIYSRINNINDCIMLQGNLNSLEEWAQKWNMRFHPDKCKILRVGKNHPPFQYTMLDNGQQCDLEEVAIEKDLGITIDNQLSFETHCSNMVSKASRTLAIIRRTLHYMDKEVLIPLYKSLVRSHLEYGVDVWSPRLKRDIQSVESVQRRATKLVPGLENLSYEERLRKLELPTMVYRRKRGEMIQVYKFLHKIWDIEEDFLTPAIDNRTRGHSLKLFKQRASSTIRCHFFCNRVTNLWNELPEYITQAPSTNAFKARLDNFWSGKPWLYDFEAE